MAIVASITAVSSAIISAYAIHKKLGNSHDEQMKSLMCQHDEAMEDLKNQRISENNRHQRLMKLLEILEEFVKTLGKTITDAEYQGCKGLPALEQRFGQTEALQIYNNYLNSMSTFNDTRRQITG